MNRALTLWFIDSGVSHTTERILKYVLFLFYNVILLMVQRIDFHKFHLFQYILTHFRRSKHLFSHFLMWKSLKNFGWLMLMGFLLILVDSWDYFWEHLAYIWLTTS